MTLLTVDSEDLYQVIRRAIRDELKLVGQAEIAQFDLDLPCSAGRGPTTSQEIKTNLERSHRSLWERYGSRPIHVAEIRGWYVENLGDFSGPDLELINGELRWWKTLYNSIRHCKVLIKAPGIKAHYIITDPGDQ